MARARPRRIPPSRVGVGGTFYVARRQPPRIERTPRGVLGFASASGNVADQAALGERVTVAGIAFTCSQGSRFLELGAGKRSLDEHLASALRARDSSTTAAVFDPDYAAQAIERGLPSAEVDYLLDGSCSACLPRASTTSLGTAILCHDRTRENLAEIHRLLKPGGQMLFFEANYWNPQVFGRRTVPALGRRAGNARCQVGMRKYRLMKAASRQGFTDIEIVPYDIVHARTPQRLIPAIQQTAFILEHVPAVREVCGTLYSGQASAATRDTVAQASTSPTTPDSMDRPRSSCPAATRR